MSTAPIAISYHGKDACGLVCYSHNPQRMSKPFSQHFIEGVVEVQGKYDGSICKPAGYEKDNISTIPKFNELCDTQIKSCKAMKKATGKGCWVDADSGNLLVIRQ
ncbi:MAG: hypothetical protein M1561_04975 [Gammaproteobacteria bacterium]|nr:hypothetical protein [Gammaproteobacteria bacterium]